jgi:uncharacterized integral membrane protein (TIGR00698 family)
MAVSLLIAVGATLLDALLRGLGITVLSGVFLAIVAGFLLRLAAGLRPSWAPGVTYTAKHVLKLGIVLLGLRFGLGHVLELGGSSLGAIATAIAVAFGAVWLLTRFVPMDHRLALLIAVGTAICGNSAIAATAPVIDAEEEQISFASATITLFGMLAMVVYPALGHALGLSDVRFGLLAGAGVHDSAQAIASGFLYSTAAGEAATVVKLTRTAFLVPILVVLSAAASRRLPRGGSLGARVRAAVPWFAVGFVLASALRTAGDALLGAPAWWEAVLSACSWLAVFLIVAAMSAVGLQTDLAKLRRIGPSSFLVGCAAAVAVAATALAFVTLL